MRGLRRVAFFALVVGVGFASAARAFDPAEDLSLAAALADETPVITATSEYDPTDTEDYDRGGIFDEVRLGGSAFLKGNHIPEGEEGAFIHGEILFDPLWGRRSDNVFLDAVLRPRPMLGATVSTEEGTNQVFGGFNWHFPIGSVLFLEASFGGTVHDGGIYEPELNLGCRVLFHESGAIGVNLGRNWRVLGFVDHSSHADLCDDENDGLTHAGAMLGYRF